MVEFKSCPDCGNFEYPMFSRNDTEDICENVAKSQVYAYCRVCDWRTKYYNNVSQCAEEWNNTVIE